MVRMGMNPARKKHTNYKPAEVTIGVLAYIPTLAGYFEQRLDILSLCINSIVQNTYHPYDLLVLDNGSSEVVRNFLVDLNQDGVIDYLLLSERNLGVLNGLRLLTQTAPGKYLAYSNDDVFYYPGWLEAHMKVFETFPDVGTVSGAPVGIQSTNASKSFNKIFHSDLFQGATTKTSRNVEWEEDWAKSTGREVEAHLKFCKENPLNEMEIEGVSVVGSASHYQFVAPISIIEQALPSEWDNNLMGGVVELDRTVDGLGYLRVSTHQRYTRHIGNALDNDLIKIAKKMGLNPKEPIRRTEKKHWLLQVPGVGRVLGKISDWIFRVLNELE